MYDKIMLCTKCKIFRKKYESNNINEYHNYKYCPYCKGILEHKDYSPNL